MEELESAEERLSRVRRELNDMAEWRLFASFSPEEEEHYNLLLGYEQLLMVEAGP